MQRVQDSVSEPPDLILRKRRLRIASALSGEERNELLPQAACGLTNSAAIYEVTFISLIALDALCLHERGVRGQPSARCFISSPRAAWPSASAYSLRNPPQAADRCVLTKTHVTCLIN